MEMWFGNFFLSWTWLDWLGLVAVIVAIAFLWSVMKALSAGEQPLKVVRLTLSALRAMLRQKR